MIEKYLKYIIFSFLFLLIIFIFNFVNSKEEIFDTQSIIKIINNKIILTKQPIKNSKLQIKDKIFNYNIQLNKIKLNLSKNNSNLINNDIKLNNINNGVKLYFFENLSFNNINKNLIFDGEIKIEFEKNYFYIQLTDNNNIKINLDSFINDILFKKNILKQNSDNNIILNKEINKIKNKELQIKLKKLYLNLLEIKENEEITIFNYIKHLKIKELVKFIKHKTKIKLTLKEGKTFLYLIQDIDKIKQNINKIDLNNYLTNNINNYQEFKNNKRIQKEKDYYLKDLILNNKESIINRIYNKIIIKTNDLLKNNSLKLKIKQNINKSQLNNNKIFLYYNLIEL